MENGWGMRQKVGEEVGREVWPTKLVQRHCETRWTIIENCILGQATDYPFFQHPLFVLCTNLAVLLWLALLLVPVSWTVVVVGRYIGNWELRKFRLVGNCRSSTVRNFYFINPTRILIRTNNNNVRKKLHIKDLVAEQAHRGCPYLDWIYLGSFLSTSWIFIVILKEAKENWRELSMSMWRTRQGSG